MAYIGQSVGIGNVASYQVSGRPFITGSVAMTDKTARIRFPAVTQWFMVSSSGPVTMAMAAHGAEALAATAGQNGWHINTNVQLAPAGPFYMKCSEVYLSASNAVETIDVIAGLTFIPIERIDNISSSVEVLQAGAPRTNWTGSIGIDFQG